MYVSLNLRNFPTLLGYGLVYLYVFLGVHEP